MIGCIRDPKEAEVAEKAFVVMQIGAKDSPERKRAEEVYDFVVAPALSEFGIQPIRADLDPSPGPITTKLIADLVGSKVVIADLTGKNPNVFYELGIAHSFGRPIVAIADSVRALPFDAKDERVIELGPYYENGLTYVQGENAKKGLIASLRIVLQDGYVPPSSVREAAGVQSLDELAPSNPVAAELRQMRETVEGMDRRIARLTGSASRHPATVSGRSAADIAAMLDTLSWVATQDVDGDELYDRLITLDTSGSHDVWVKETLPGVTEEREQLAADGAPWDDESRGEPPF